MVATRLPCTAFHVQNTCVSCGGATAQMLLASSGAGVLDQDQLLAQAHTSSLLDDGWRVAPDGLATAVAKHQPAGSAHTFEVVEGTSEEEISRLICWTIRSSGVAPAALVRCAPDFSHWLVVTGFQASAQPGSPDDGTYTIHGFDLHDPIAFVDPIEVVAHQTGDDCGSDHIIHGYPHRHIAYCAWQEWYMLEVVQPGCWHGNFIAICDQTAAADPDCLVEEEQSHSAIECERGAMVIGAERAGAEADNGLREHGLLERKDWRDARGGTERGEAMLVELLDHPEHAFYLVPYLIEERVPLVVAVNAYTGAYEESIARPGASTHIAAMFDWETGKNLYLDPDLNAFGRLFWQPCQESLSRFWPFVVIDTNGQRTFTRIDGRSFTELTPGHGL